MADSAAGPTKQWAGLVSCMACYVALTVHLVWAEVPIDDAFITYRYAERLIAGDGLVFNGGERVEGYSSLAWTLVVAALRAMGIGAETGSRLVGLGCGLGCIAVVGSWPARAFVRFWAMLALATALPCLYHWVNGLETAFATLLLCGLARARSASGHKALVAQASASLLLAWTRPEGAFLVLSWCLAERLGPKLSRPAYVAVPIAAALGGGGVQLGFRLLYYGDWMANSARAKLLPLSAALPRGLSELVGFSWYTSAWGLGLAGVVYASASAARGREVDSDERAHVLRWSAFLIIASALIARSGGDSYALWRFFVPLSPFACLLAAQGLGWLVARYAPRRVWLAYGLSIACLLAARWHDNRALLPSLSNGWQRHWAAVGLALKNQVERDATLALCPVGTIPYVSGLPTIDMLGLTEPAIARVPADLRYDYPGHQRHAGSHVLDRKPDLILLANGPVVPRPTSQFPWHQLRVYERDLVADPRFSRDYTLAHLPLARGGFVQLHARKAYVRR